MQLNDGTSTQVSDQIVSLVVTNVGGSVVVELLQQNNSDSTANTAEPADTTTILASQTLTSAQLASDDQIEFSLAHTAGSTAITGSFELLDNGVADPTTATTFATTGTIFTGDVTSTRANVYAGISPGVGLNIGGGVSPHEGQVLTASATTNDPDATAINYQWEESTSSSPTTFTDIGTDSSTYTVQESDIGNYIRVVATTNDSDNLATTATSAVTGAVLPLPAYAYTTIDDASAVQPYGTAAYGINGNGLVVGSYNSGTDGSVYGFLYSDGSFPTTIAYPGSEFSGGGTFAFGINGSGEVVGNFTVNVDGDYQNHGFLYDPGSATPYAKLNVAGATATDAYGINDSGEIVGTYTEGGVSYAFADNGGTFTTLSGTIAYGINDAGEIVGANGNAGFLYNPGTGYTTIVDPSATGATVATGINDAGEIVGYYTDGSGTHGFVDIGGVFTTIDEPAATAGTYIFGINDSGQIVGYYDDANGVHGFVALPLDTWNGAAGDSNWSTAGNWSANSPPSPGQEAVIPSGDSPQIVSSIELDFIALQNGGTITVASGGSLTLDDGSTASGGTLQVGPGATLSLDDAAVTDTAILVGPSTLITTVNDPSASPPTPPSAPQVYGEAINASGEIVGNYLDAAGNSYGFLYDNGVYTAINDSAAGYSGGEGTTPYDINAAGTISGFYVDAAGVNHGFLYSGGNFTTIDDSSAGTAAGQGTIAISVNNSGEVAGFYVDGSGLSHGFIDDGGNFTTLDDPNPQAVAGTTQGIFVNNSGEVAGIYKDANGNDHGFIYDNGAYINVDDPNADFNLTFDGFEPDLRQHHQWHQQFRRGGRLLLRRCRSAARLYLQRRQQRHLHHADRSLGGIWHFRPGSERRRRRRRLLRRRRGTCADLRL